MADVAFNVTESPDNDLLVRVRKLLDKAERTSNAHEADAFSRKAAELIAEHRIDPDRLGTIDAGDELRVREIELGRGAYVRARLALLLAVADAHDVRVVFQARPNGTVAMAAGFRSDLDVVEVLYTSLHQQAAAQMAAVRRPTGAATQRFRRSYLFGFADRIGQLLGESKHRADERADHGVGVNAGRAAERALADTGSHRPRRGLCCERIRAGACGAGTECRAGRRVGGRRGGGRQGRCRSDAASGPTGDRPCRSIVSEADHAAVYAAEVAAFDGTDLEEVRPFETIEALLRRVIASAWWPGGSVDVLRARADAVSSTTRCGMADQGNDGPGRGDRGERPRSGRNGGGRGAGDRGAEGPWCWGSWCRGQW